jgi:hypothetical protein
VVPVLTWRCSCKSGVVAERREKRVEIECDDVLGAIGFERLDPSSLLKGLDAEKIEYHIIASEKGAGHCLDAIHAWFWQALDI